MKRFYFILSSICLLVLGLKSCTGSSADDLEIWGLRMGETQTKIFKNLEGKGLDVDMHKDYISLESSFQFKGIDWEGGSCGFDKSGRLCSITFKTTFPVDESESHKLVKYLESMGFVGMGNNPMITEKLLRGEAVTLTDGDCFYKGNYEAKIKRNDWYGMGSETIFSVYTTSAANAEQAEHDDLIRRLQNGETVTIHTDL